MESINAKPKVKSTLFFTFVLALVFNCFFTEKEFGISFPIFILLCIFVFLWNEKNSITKNTKSIGWVLILPILLLAFTFPIYSNMILLPFNILIVLFLMISSSILICNENIPWEKLEFIKRVLYQSIYCTFKNLFLPIKCIFKFLVVKDGYRLSSKFKNILIGICISVPLIVILLNLLISADMVFGYYLSKSVTWIAYIEFNTIFFRGFIILCVFLYLGSYFLNFNGSRALEEEFLKTKSQSRVYTLESPESDESISTNLENKSVSFSLPKETMITILVLIDAIYLTFTIIQFSYLYGGATGALPTSFTYAEYARRGFFELIFVTLINLSILLLFISYRNLLDKISKNIINTLLSLTLIFTLVMLFSSNYKLTLYESSYGYTDLRIFVHMFLITLLILFAIILIGIWRDSFPLTKVLIISLLTIYVVVNYVNVEKIVAIENIKRFEQTTKIDFDYLSSLSYDALPAMIQLTESANVDIANAAKEYLQRKKLILAHENKSWYEFNYSKYRAKKLLSGF